MDISRRLLLADKENPYPKAYELALLYRPVKRCSTQPTIDFNYCASVVYE